MQVVVLDGFMVQHGLDPWFLGESFQVSYYDETPPDQVVSRIGNAEAVFVNRVQLTKGVFEACPTLRFVGSFGTGFNQIDVEAARAAGVTVCNVPDYGTDAVAQHTLSLLLTIACQTSAHHNFIKAGEWRSLSDPPLVNRGSFELCGKTLALIGYGNIARTVGRMANSFGMHVTVYCRHPERVQRDPWVQFLPLDQILPQADVVSLHCPLTPETHGMVNANFLFLMKRGAVLINTARGAIFDDHAVMQALDAGRLWMVGMDTFSEEPVSSEHPLAFHSRVISTPHIAWTPSETRTRLLEISAQNLRCFLAGKPQNVVN